MYKILIADDEPLVQVGLRSMIERDFSDEFTLIGAASNGKEALAMIEEHRPDVVISDIKMPLMSGLELLETSRKRHGQLPVFIMLTAYEEFDLARRALAGQAIDYLIKIELNKKTLSDALEKAKERILEYSPDASAGTDLLPGASVEEFRQKFLLRILDRQITDEVILRTEAADLGLGFDYDRYLVSYCEIAAALPEDDGNDAKAKQANEKLLTLYSSCLTMSREIIERYSPCRIVSNDLRHFTILFYFMSDQPIADRMQVIDEAVTNARDMIFNYFNVPLFFGIGTAVTGPLSIADSFEEAKTAQEQADPGAPVRQFSHIVGTNRRSGKDKLIASIQEYIDENMSGRLQLSEVAEIFGLSPAYLSVIFKKNTDVGFSEYVYTKKIEKAKQMLLSGDMKIYEVADALGFESAYYFSKVFKKVDGHSPREYINSKSSDS